MKMEYSELKERFAEFHAEKITKSELVAAIGLYQRMNHIFTAKGVTGYKIIHGKKPTLQKINYIPRNISPRILGFYLDAEYEYKKEKKEFFNSVHGEYFGGK